MAMMCRGKLHPVFCALKRLDVHWMFPIPVLLTAARCFPFATAALALANAAALWKFDPSKRGKR
jgi:hypothetical protein